VTVTVVRTSVVRSFLIRRTSSHSDCDSQSPPSHSALHHKHTYNNSQLVMSNIH